MNIRQAIHELIDAGAWVARNGMTWGSAGNISIKTDDNFLVITASGTHLNHLDENSFTILNLETGTMEGAKPSKELPVHLAAYQAAPYAQAALHASPFYTTLAASSDLSVPNDLFVENMYYLQRIVYVPYAHPGSAALAALTKQAAQNANVILMRNHGALILDVSIKEAMTGLEILERTCQMALEAQRTGISLSHLPKETVQDFLLNSSYRPLRPWQK